MRRPWWKSNELLQYAAAAGSLATLLVLAVAGLWPFDAGPIEPGDQPSITEVVLGDRLAIGLVRIALAALVGYVVASVPALVVDRRWVQGLTTTGLTADVRAADPWKDEMRDGIARISDWLEAQGDQGEVLREVLESLRLDDSPQNEGAERDEG